MNKKIICIILSVIMLVSLAACGKEQPEDEMSDSSGVSQDMSGSTITTTTTTTENVGSTITETSTTATVTTTAAATTAKISKPTSTSTTTTTTVKTTTTTVPAKKSWFDEQGFKITPLTKNMCFNKNTEHICGTESDVGIEIDKEGSWDKRGDDSFSSITFYFNSRNCFDMSKGDSLRYRAMAFDRNTGIVFSYSTDIFTEFVVNGKKYFSQFADGIGGGYYNSTVCCSADYEGTVFVIASDWIIHPMEFSDEKTHTIDECIDFDTAEYYFFSASNK